MASTQSSSQQQFAPQAENIFPISEELTPKINKLDGCRKGKKNVCLNQANQTTQAGPSQQVEDLCLANQQKQKSLAEEIEAAELAVAKSKGFKSYAEITFSLLRKFLKILCISD